jgi:TonB-dependent starch-binding outer membrane protein SusC
MSLSMFNPERRAGARPGWPLALCMALLALVVGLEPASAQAQTGTITGMVITQTGEPVSGAQVVIVGTQRGTLTNARGAFILTAVPAGEQQVRIVSLGYRTETQTVNVPADGTVSVEFRLAVSAIALDAVVVTGQATGAARRELGTSVAAIDAQALELAPINNVSNLLQARAPGVNILPGGGKSGQGTRIVLRGASSVSQANEPLIYVDGVRMDRSATLGVETTTAGVSWNGLDDLNPADIERVEIVRGASAATIYGTEAAAGVIQIFTRRGSEGRAVWNYSSELGLLTTPRDWWDVSVYSPWFYDNMVQNGNTQSHQLSVRGGGEAFNYYAGGSFRSEDGILPNNAEDAYSFRLNLGVSPRDDMTLRLNTSFTQRSVQVIPDANNTRGYTINGLMKGAMGQFVETLTLPEIRAFQEGTRFLGGITVEHQATGALSHRVTLGTDVWNQDQHQLFPFQAISNLPLGFRSNYRRENRNMNLDYSATFRANITEDIRTTTSAGFQYFHRNTGSSSAIGNDFPFYGIETVSGALRTSAGEWRVEEKMAGFFGEQQFAYGNLLFLNLGLRADGHSAFGADVDYQLYPKASVSYVLSEQFPLPEFLGTLRLRGAYGTAGQQPTNFAAVRTWSTTSAVGAQPAVFPTNLGNPDLRPEVTHEMELGFEMGFLNDRFVLDVTRYDQTTKDALYAVREPPSQGVLSPQLRNVGEISNTGWEMAARGTVLELPRFRWEGLVNFTTNSNEIINLGGGAPLQLQWLQWMREGYPVGSFFGDRPIEHNGEVIMASTLCVAGQQPVEGQTEACIIGGSPGAIPIGWDYIGPPLPTRTMQIGSNFTIGSRTSFNVLFDHRAGAYAQSSTMRWLMQPNQDVTQAHIDRNAELGYPGLATTGAVANVCRDARAAAEGVADVTTLPVQTQKYLLTCNRNSALTHGDFAMLTDFWKLREVSLGYRLPEAVPQRFGMSSATVSLTGRNLWRDTPYIGLEPESMYRNDLSDSALRSQIFFDTPIPRQITVGIRAQF